MFSSIARRAFQTSAPVLDKTLFVRNIPWSVTETDLSSAFGDHGNVLRCKIVTDKFTGRSRGFGFIDMNDAEGDAAIKAMDGMEMAGRQIAVTESDPNARRAPRDEGQQGY